MKKHSDNNVKDIYSFGAVIYVAERTLLVGYKDILKMNQSKGKR